MSTHPVRRGLLLLAVAAVMLALFAAFLLVFQLPAGAAPAGLPPGGWLVKADDLARVSAEGPVPSFEWVSCGGRCLGKPTHFQARDGRF